MRLDLDELEAAARHATGRGRPWKYDGPTVGFGPHAIARASGEHDARFIALASPATVLALVERVRRAEEALRAVVEHGESYECSFCGECSANTRRCQDVACQACLTHGAEHDRGCAFEKARATLAAESGEG